MLNKPFKVLIGKDINWDAHCVGGLVLMATGGAGYNAHAADGEVLVLNKYKQILTAGDTIGDTDTIYIGQATGVTYDFTGETGVAATGARKFIFSNPIEGSLVTSYLGKAYTALAEQVTTFTCTSLVVTAGIELVLRLVYRDLQEEKGGGQFVHSYHYTCVTGETVDSAAIAIAALVNAHVGRRVNATLNAGADSLILTGRHIASCTTSLDDIDEFKMVEFNAYLNYIDADGYQQETLATQATTAAVYGQGTWELVRDLEKVGRGYKGFTNQTTFPILKPAWSTVLDETYDCIVIEHKKSYLAPDNTYTKSTPLKTVIFIPNTVANNQMDSILACLNPWMASLPLAFSNVTF